MKSILLKETSPLTLLLLLIFSAGLFYNFSTLEKLNKKTEYLSIVVDYNIRTQTISITEGTTVSKEIKNQNLENIFDNKLVFKLLQQYETKGWKLESHTFGVGNSQSYHNKISYYLFTK
ncbi:MAG: hypothetical protein AB8H03_00770 [Saprospiraceae bacterium]